VVTGLGITKLKIFNLNTRNIHVEHRGGKTSTTMRGSKRGRRKHASIFNCPRRLEEDLALKILA